MILRSMQTNDPGEAWAQVHKHLVGYVHSKRIPGEYIYEKLSMYCRGKMTEKSTVRWEVENDLLIAHCEDMPTSYSLTKAGQDWKQNL